jgi:hypothetical protein
MTRWMARADYERKPQKCAYGPCERPALPHGKVCEFHGLAYREQRNKERAQKRNTNRPTALQSSTHL